jgi:hypothetical protein
MTDDELIREVRERAYDPARRLDEVPIRLAALAETTDPVLAEMRRVYTGHLRGYTTVPGGSGEAAAFYRGAPCGPLVPPLPAHDLARRAGELGVRLPLLLRRLYTEVGDGGFGPAYGILGIGEHGYGNDGHHTAADLYTTPTLADWLEDWLLGRDRLVELVG